MRLSQRVCDNGLRVNFDTFFKKKIFHLFVEEENNVYKRYTTPKKDTVLVQEFAISQSTRLML